MEIASRRSATQHDKARGCQVWAHVFPGALQTSVALTLPDLIPLGPQHCQEKRGNVTDSSVAKTYESVEKLGSEQILLGLTSPCCATAYCREEERR